MIVVIAFLLTHRASYEALRTRTVACCAGKPQADTAFQPIAGPAMLYSGLGTLQLVIPISGDHMQVNDLPLAPSDVRQLESADEIARFFARLGYNVDRRINIPDYALLGLGSADLRQQIHKIELIGTDPADGDITIYLLEVRSVTARSSCAARRSSRSAAGDSRVGAGDLGAAVAVY